jgi:methionine-rich copper-binding protein CopC
VSCNYSALVRGQRGLRLAATLGATVLTLAISTGSALAHSYPQTTDPQSNARLDAAPAHIGITYDSNIAQSGSSMVLLDATGSAVPTAPDPTGGNRQTSIHPMTDLAPGPYTVDWTSLSADDGHQAQGFYTFVVNGGSAGIIAGQAQAQAQAADLMASLTVTAADDGSSLLRVDLDNPTGVERVRIRLSRPDLGEDLLTTTPTADGGWALTGNEVAIPGPWHAVVIVRRTNVVDDAQGSFDFTVDSVTGAPAFATASAAGLN